MYINNLSLKCLLYDKVECSFASLLIAKKEKLIGKNLIRSN
jgi:hypothetical protein